MKILNLISSHLKIHWKLILTISISWSLLVSLCLMLPLLFEAFSIAPGTLWSRRTRPDGGQGSGTIETMNISMFYNIFFMYYGFVFYGFIILLFINIIVLKEIKTTQISLWLTQPFSKMQIALSKFLFLIIVITSLYIVPFITLNTVSAFAVDAKAAWSNIFIGSIQVYLFLIMLAAIFYSISLFMVEKNTLFNVIISFIIGYFLLIAAIQMYLDFSLTESKFLTAIVNYCGLQLFLAEVLPYNLNSDEYIIYILSETTSSSGVITTLEFEIPPLESLDKVFLGLLIPAMAIISTSLGAVSMLRFKKMSFNI